MDSAAPRAWLTGLCACCASLPWAVAAQAGPAADATEISVVLVTARRIEENLQNIPMSVQALSGEFQDETGITRLLDLQFAVPGLVVNSAGMAGIGFSLRGIADQRVTGLSVAPHLNGIYLGNANLATARIFDMERVEILKGPQGTLYGRNATGGSINFITRPPEHEFNAAIEGSYGSFATTRAQGHVNLPLQEAAVRIAFIASEGDGYIRNSVDDRTFSQEDYWGVRASLRLDPSENLRIDVMAQHLRDDGASGELWSPRPDFLLNPSDIQLTTVTLANPYLVSDIDNFNVNLQYDLGFATLRSITGYGSSDIRNLDDCAGIPLLAGCVRGASPALYDQWSQEIQLVFAPNEAINGIVGAYYSDADIFINFHQLLPVLNPEPLSDVDSTMSEPAAAIFGQATWQLADRWNATAGVRMSWEEHRIETIGTGVLDSHTLLVAEDDSDDLSWRLDLQHAVTDDLLLYAGVSTGYKSGGFVGTTLVDGVPDIYGPENLTAYEAGGKTQWLDRRLTLNAAAFYYDFEDLQVSRTYFDGNRIIVEVDNAAKAELYGVDFEFDIHASDRLSFSAGAVWLAKREFTQFDGNVTGDDLTGNKLVRAPEWSAVGAIDYEQPLLQSGVLSARLEYSFRSDFFYTPENDPAFAQDSFGLLNLFLRFEAVGGNWYLFASGRNLTDEDYFHHVFLQSSPGQPDTYEVGAGYRF
jgi:iron complex outermembrane receptor protein